MQGRVEAALATALSGSGIAGAVALVVDADGVLAEVALGHPTDARFALASMTKAIVSVGALKLVEQAELSLDSPLGDMLPALANPQVIEGFDGDTPILRPATTAITLRHLLTHTSGLGYDFVQPEVSRARRTPPVPGQMSSITMPLLFDSGTNWAYGVSTDWVAQAVAAATGERFDVWLAREVLAPLGMADTRYGDGSVPVLMRGPDGGVAPFPGFSMYNDGFAYVPGGAGLSATAGDYGRFLQMILRGGDGLLSEAMVRDFGTNQIGSLRAGIMPSTMPWLALPFDAMPGQHCGWGLGTLINPEPGPNGRSAHSLSWAGIANSFYWVDPAAGLAGVLMMQLLPFADPAALGVLTAFERAVYAS